ncbi:MAG: YraN family protein [Bacteroidales bacterium]|nr:YraN family protein [Bacteroidales bacterium]
MRNQDTGKWGEDEAVKYLVGQGYAIVERNWKLNHLEVDIIASTGDLLVFVEVKTRKEPGTDPVMAVNRGKRQRIISAADAYLRLNGIPLDYRFDIITVIGTREKFSLDHIPEAYHPALKRINYSFKL